MAAPADLRPSGTTAVLCAGVMHVYSGEDRPIVALRNVDLDVEAGEMVAILGPSGSGKSTLLALLSGMFRPFAGSVIVASHDMGRVDGAALARLRSTEISLLLQEPLHNLLPYAGALDNIAFAQRGARRRKWPLRWSPSDLVDAFDLGGVARRPVHQLAAGEQQRIAAATAVGISPKVLLADEPTCQLDPAGRDGVVAALRQAHELSGATVVVVTHDPKVADALPRTVEIANGVIGVEGRKGRRFTVVGSDGGIQLPAEVLARYPAGTLFSISVEGELVALRPRTFDDPDGPEL